MQSSLQIKSLMEKALEISLPCNQPINELRSNLIVYSTLVANMQHQIKKLSEENHRYKNAILAIQANNRNILKEELSEAFYYLDEHLREMDKLLTLFKLNSNAVNIDFVIEYNIALQNGLTILIELLRKYLNHEETIAIEPI